MPTDTPAYADRYVAAVARAVPARVRDEITAELRATIADEVEPRLDAGESIAEAERAVVARLGEPLAYAASLTDRPLQLIGPRYFAAWWRLLKLLLWIVPVCAVFGVMLGELLRGADIGGMIGAAIPVLIQVVVNIGFWTTLVFVVLERTGSTGDTILDWTPDNLPQRAAVPTARYGDVIATVVCFAILVGSVLWDRAVGWGRDHVHLLSADLWPVVILVWFGILAVAVVIEVVAVVRGRWTLPMALASALLALATLVGALMLIWQNRVLDHELVARILDISTPSRDVLKIVNITLTVVVGGIMIGVGFDAFRKLGVARKA